jgi:hypothetical protein
MSIAIEVQTNRSVTGQIPQVPVIDDPYLEPVVKYIYEQLQYAFDPIIIVRSYKAFNSYQESLNNYPLLKAYRQADQYAPNTLWASSTIAIQHCMSYPINSDLAKYGVQVGNAIAQCLLMPDFIEKTGVQVDLSVPLQIQYDTQLNANYEPVMQFVTATCNIYTSAL